MVLGFNKKRRFKIIKRIFDNGSVGGFYPILPGVNLWKDESKTIKAYIPGDRVKVIGNLYGNYGDLICQAPDPGSCAKIELYNGRYCIKYYGAHEYLIDDISTISSQTSIIVNAATLSQGGTDTYRTIWYYEIPEGDNGKGFLSHNAHIDEEYIYSTSGITALIEDIAESQFNVITVRHDMGGTNFSVYRNGEMLSSGYDTGWPANDVSLSLGAKRKTDDLVATNFFRGYISGFCIINNNSMDTIRIIEDRV